MYEENESIRIGRISRAMERALGLSLPSDVNIYMTGKDLDALAKKRPDSYLKAVSEIAFICKQPDFVSFDEAKQRFYFLRLYFKNEVFSAVWITVSLQGSPQKWRYETIGSSAGFSLKQALPGLGFVRPDWKNTKTHA